MSSLKKLIANVWFLHGHISKKAYTAGMIVISGMMAIAVMLIGVNGFAVAQDVKHIPSYEMAEEEKNDATELEMLSEDLLTDESLQQIEQWANANYEMMTKAAEVSTTTDEPTLMKETDLEKNLRTSGNLDGNASNLVNVKDYTALIKIVEAEATSEDLKGKVLIANVVMNRVNSKRFPNSIYGVVHQEINGRAQFSPIDDGRYYSVKVTSSTEKAVELALNGTDYSNGALFFVAKSLTSEKAGSWFDDHLNFVLKHGVHSFYKY